MSVADDVEDLVCFEIAPSDLPNALIVILWRRLDDAGGFGIRCGEGKHDDPVWTDTPVSDDAAASLLASFEALRLPIVPDFVLGCDGTNYRLRIHRGYNATELAWWSEPPRQWKRLMPLVQRLLDLAGQSDWGVDVVGE
jgi:hypothetical protein